LVDEQFKNVGMILLDYLTNSKNFFIHFHFICDSFSELMLNNLEFSQLKLFPHKDIRMIKSKLQVELLLVGKNFILLPNVLVKCSDMQFQFQ
jgi:hypothetical protein